MERLSSAYAYLWETCGPWGIALLACMIILFFVQFWYWVGYYGRIPSYRNARAGDARPPVSVALVVHEPDYDFLENGLPVLLGQEYDDFEIIVTDLSGDVEFGEALAVIAEHNPRFNVTRMVRDARFPISDKMAFNVAIKAARYDNILLTTVDSRPASLQWIARMARGFDGAGIVIGYCGMEGASAFSSRLIRLDNAARAIRWLSAAMHGKPYRGTLQNIGFTKALYFGNGGFNYLNMNIGEDDLYMQKVMGLAEVNYEGEIPAEYVLTQDILVDWFPTGETTVNVYTNADHSKVLYTFFGWGENIMVEGLLINDRVADVTYDSVGYFEADAPLMWELVDPNAWVPVA